MIPKTMADEMWCGQGVDPMEVLTVGEAGSSILVGLMMQ